MTPRALGAAALLGTAAGIRTMVPLAALGLTLSRRRLAAPLALLSASELVYDKLPRAGERTSTGQLSARIGVGAIAGAVVGRVSRAPIALTAATGALAALVSAFVSHRLRAEAAQRVPPLAAAVGDDLLAIGSAGAALRLLAREP